MPTQAPQTGQSATQPPAQVSQPSASARVSTTSDRQPVMNPQRFGMLFNNAAAAYREQDGGPSLAAHFAFYIQMADELEARYLYPDVNPVPEPPASEVETLEQELRGQEKPPMTTEAHAITPGKGWGDQDAQLADHEAYSPDDREQDAQGLVADTPPWETESDAPPAWDLKDFKQALRVATFTVNVSTLKAAFQAQKDETAFEAMERWRKDSDKNNATYEDAYELLKVSV